MNILTELVSMSSSLKLLFLVSLLQIDSLLTLQAT